MQDATFPLINWANYCEPEGGTGGFQLRAQNNNGFSTLKLSVSPYEILINYSNSVILNSQLPGIYYIHVDAQYEVQCSQKDAKYQPNRDFLRKILVALLFLAWRRNHSRSLCVWVIYHHAEEQLGFALSPPIKA